MRGERGHSNTSSRWRCGSSPHARGTLLGVFRPLAGTRFIPACAGNAYRFPAEWWAEAVHPRMRGERQVAHRRPGERDGSSPHARGTRLARATPWTRWRFIPACAGNAHKDISIVGLHAVHPRMRGERPSHEPVPPLPGGSSPHARGTHDLAWRGQHVVRFIPACAGNAPAPRATAESPSVHPRMRGERQTELFARRSQIGSSPHARGTPRHAQPDRAWLRFIPACAGNAHGMVQNQTVLPGSSPHARGTLSYREFLGGCFRFIPACAGNA